MEYIGIFTYIWSIFGVNVGIHTNLHGSWKLNLRYKGLYFQSSTPTLVEDLSSIIILQKNGDIFDICLSFVWQRWEIQHLHFHDFFKFKKDKWHLVLHCVSWTVVGSCAIFFLIVPIRSLHWWQVKPWNPQLDHIPWALWARPCARPRALKASSQGQRAKVAAAVLRTSPAWLVGAWQSSGISGIYGVLSLLFPVVVAIFTIQNLVFGASPHAQKPCRNCGGHEV